MHYARSFKKSHLQPSQCPMVLLFAGHLFFENSVDRYTINFNVNFLHSIAGFARSVLIGRCKLQFTFFHHATSNFPFQIIQFKIWRGFHESLLMWMAEPSIFHHYESNCNQLDCMLAVTLSYLQWSLWFNYFLESWLNWFLNNGIFCFQIGFHNLGDSDF